MEVSLSHKSLLVHNTFLKLTRRTALLLLLLLLLPLPFPPASQIPGTTASCTATALSKTGARAAVISPSARTKPPSSIPRTPASITLDRASAGLSETVSASAADAPRSTSSMAPDAAVPASRLLMLQRVTASPTRTQRGLWMRIAR
jgi:hypothetical protein